MIHIKTKYINELGYIERGKYGNGKTALILMSAHNDTLTVATVNLPKIDLKEDQVIIKDYSENEGVREFLEYHNIVEGTGIIIQPGFAQLEVCKLLPENEWDLKK